MAIGAGDKIVVVPTGLSQTTCVKLQTPAEGTTVASIPTDGKTIGVPVGPLNVGSKAVFVPDVFGNYIPLRAEGHLVPIGIGYTQIIALDNGVLLACQYNMHKVWRSTDDGAKWKPYDLTETIGDKHTWRLLDLGSGTVLLATDSTSISDGHRMSVYKSTDYGITWTFSWEMPVDEDDYTVHPNSLQKYGANIYIAGYNKIKVWKSTNAGASFTEMLDLGLGDATMAVCPDDGYIVVAEDGGTLMGHVWQSTDAGANWSDVYYYGTIVDPWTNENANAQSCTIVGGTFIASVQIFGWHAVHAEGIWVMKDESHGAGTHTEVQINPPATHSYYFWYIYNIPGGNNLIGYVGTSGAGYSLYTSADAGSSWTKRDAAPAIQTCWYVADLSLVFGVDSSNLLYTSDDDGASWDLITTYEA